MTNPQNTMLSIESMTCASCVGRVDRGLGAMDGVSDVSINLASETARLSVDKPERLIEAAQKLDELGYPARRASVTLNVASMTCASCVGRVDKALAKIPGVLDVNVNLAAETATVSYLEGVTDAAALATAASQAGYPAEVAASDATLDRTARKEEEAREIARRTILAAALALPVFLLPLLEGLCEADAFELDARRCISYLTIEHKGAIPEELRPLMGNRIYGCDDCLAVCPWNKFAAATTEPAFLPRAELTAPRLADLAQLDDKAFRQLFAGSPIKRLGSARFIRNVLIALGNSGDKAQIPVAEALTADDDPVVRDAAVWAVGRLKATTPTR